MATLVQSASFSNSGVIEVPVTFGSNVTAGNRIVVQVTRLAATALSGTMVTDTQGNTYTLDVTSQSGQIGFFSTVAGSTGANTVTYNSGGANQRMAIAVREFSGLDAYGSVTATATATSTDVDTGNFTPASATGVTLATILLVAAQQPTWETDFDTGDIAEAAGRAYFAYDLAPAASAQSVTATITSAQWFATAAWYPDTSGGGGLAPGVALYHLRQQGIS